MSSPATPFRFTELGGLVMEEPPPGAKTLVLHMCCAPDSAYIFKALRAGAPCDIAGFFYDPNIHPREEYDLRLDEALRVGEALGVSVYEGEYDASEFFRRTRGLEREPEGGARCIVCFDMRLERTARFCRERKFDAFATVLTVSPHKNAALINHIGREMAARCGVVYVASDFKKKDGFKRSVEEGEAMGLYRQERCGCAYGKPSDAHPALR
ncbi:MAG: epoxyqueuosine reductase QueH [Acidobacteriota bacterium]|nr:MAG: epoxyqueuosine reductase QueH [Acidobacteriota bacterium]